MREINSKSSNKLVLWFKTIAESKEGWDFYRGLGYDVYDPVEAKINWRNIRPMFKLILYKPDVQRLTFAEALELDIKNKEIL